MKNDNKMTDYGKIDGEKGGNNYCIFCDYYGNDIYKFKRHLQTKKHIKNSLTENDGEKGGDVKSNKFMCNICNYVTYCKRNYTRHLSSKKHILLQQKQIENICECGKKYKFNSGLSRHKNKCPFLKKSIQDDNKCDLIIYENKKKEISNKLATADVDTLSSLLQELIEINKQILEKPSQNQNININNQFNIMNYLNNDCKNALNIEDFFKQIKYSYDDLLQLSEQSWVENFNDTVGKQLSILDKTMRPIHCSDKKRKKFVCKYNEEWKKDIECELLFNSLEQFYNDQTKLLCKWSKINKTKIYDDDYLHDKYLNTMKKLCKVSFKVGEKLRKQMLLLLSDFSIKD